MAATSTDDGEHREQYAYWSNIPDRIASLEEGRRFMDGVINQVDQKLGGLEADSRSNKEANIRIEGRLDKISDKMDDFIGHAATQADLVALALRVTEIEHWKIQVTARVSAYGATGGGLAYVLFHYVIPWISK